MASAARETTDVGYTPTKETKPTATPKGRPFEKPLESVEFVNAGPNQAHPKKGTKKGRAFLLDLNCSGI